MARIQNCVKHRPVPVRLVVHNETVFSFFPLVIYLEICKKNRSTHNCMKNVTKQYIGFANLDLTKPTTHYLIPFL